MSIDRANHVSERQYMNTNAIKIALSIYEASFSPGNYC